MTSIQYGAENPQKRLQSVILCKPTYFSVEVPICDWQKPWVGKVDSEKARQQHQNLAEKLTSLNISVYYLREVPGLFDQTFVRDTGIFMQHGAILGSFEEDIRKEETIALAEFCDLQGIPIIGKYPFEGGDIYLRENYVIAGQGVRTQLTPEEAEKIFRRKAYSIRHTSSHHLDAVFHELPDETIALYDKFVDSRNSYFTDKKIMCLRDADIELMSANFLTIDHKTILADAAPAGFNQQLRNKGYDVIEVDVSELKKGGGSIRCLTLELYRG